MYRTIEDARALLGAPKRSTANATGHRRSR
jgi:hypothetical protein